MSLDEGKLNEVTGEIIRCAFAVSNELGAGFLEKVYENALAHELRKAGLAVEQQRGMQVVYDGVMPQLSEGHRHESLPLDQLRRPQNPNQTLP